MYKKIVCILLVLLMICSLSACGTSESKSSGNYKKLSDAQKTIVDTLYSSRNSWEKSPPQGYSLPFQSVDLYKDENGDLYFFVLTKDVSDVTGNVPSYAVYGTKIKCYKINEGGSGLSEAQFEVSNYFSINNGYTSEESLNGKPFSYKYTNSTAWKKTYSEKIGKDRLADLVIALGL